MRHTLVLAALAALAVNAPALAGERPPGGGHDRPTCPGGCGGGQHRPPPGYGGGRPDINVNVNANANAHASAYAAADARSYLNARSYAVDSGRRGGGGGSVYIGAGGYSEVGYMETGGYYASVETLGPPPVSAPFGYRVSGYGRTYIGWRPAWRRDRCDCAPPPRVVYEDVYREEAWERETYEARHASRYHETYRSHASDDRRVLVEAPPIYVRGPAVHVAAPEVYLEPPEVHVAPPVYVTPPPVYVQSPPVYVAAPEVRVEAPVVHMPPPVYVTPPPVEVQAPPVYVAPPEVHAAPPPPPPHHLGDLPPPDAVPPAPPPRHNYRQEPGERG